MPNQCAFYFQASGLPLCFIGIWSKSMHKVNLALKAVVFLLLRMAFCLSGKVVALHLDNSTAKTYLSNLVEVRYSLEQYIGLKEDKLSSTTVDFIRSEGNLETKRLYWFSKPKMC